MTTLFSALLRIALLVGTITIIPLLITWIVTGYSWKDINNRIEFYDMYGK